ncbi:hypothetical protein KFE25_000719 [Diacronema lutheri]|uniref:Anoctamin transmembrane domain-containing protein n=1 Tax=Diacronema lutheri TaxID=2081491 RepID=A0A8J5XHI6_DIALT|nr:hypothetical protein KFE25_000719 [Diacronema lutheri]
MVDDSVKLIGGNDTYDGAHPRSARRSCRSSIFAAGEKVTAAGSARTQSADNMKPPSSRQHASAPAARPARLSAPKRASTHAPTDGHVPLHFHGDTNPRPDPAKAALDKADADGASLTPADVILVLKHDRLEEADSEGDKRRKKAEKAARGKIYKQIAHSGLTLRRRQSTKLDHQGRPKYMYLVLSASEEMLEKEAERLGMMKALVEQYTDPLTGVSGYEPYTADARVKFRDDHEDGGLFTSLERQRIIFNKLEADVTDGGAGLDTDDLVALNDTFTAIFPLDHQPTVDKLEAWLWRVWEPCPVDTLRAYYGEQVAFTFAFMQHYVRYLGVMFVPATIVFAMQLYLGEIDNELLPIFAVALAIWSTLVVESWKQRSAGLAFRWASEEFLEAEAARAEFIRHPLSTRRAGVHTAIGFVPTDDLGIQSRQVPYIPPLLQYGRIGATTACTATLMTCVTVAAVAILGWKVVLRAQLSDTWWGIYLGSIVNVAFMQVMTFVWSYVGIWLTELEVWRTDTEYENALFLKSVTFRFINAYTPPLYIAFFQGQRVRLFLSYPKDSPRAGEPVVDSCPNDDCLGALNAYMIVVICLEGVRNLSTLAPLVLAWARNVRRRRRVEASGVPVKPAAQRGMQFVSDGVASAASREIAQIEKDARSPAYAGTTVEMIEMAVQFGYLCSFAIAFPLALMFVLLNNYVEIRTDALKLFKSRRPRFRGASGVGPLLPVLEMLSVVSVVVNALLIYFYSATLRTALPNLTPERFLLGVVIVEHLVFAAKFFIVRAISPVPKWVEASRTRLKIRRDEEVKSLLRTKAQFEIEAMDVDDDDELEGLVKPNNALLRV